MADEGSPVTLQPVPVGVAEMVADARSIAEVALGVGDPSTGA